MANTEVVIPWKMRDYLPRTLNNVVLYCVFFCVIFQLCLILA